MIIVNEREVDKMNKTVDELMEILTILDMNFIVNHTNDYSELIIPRNNELVNCVVMFDCGSRKIIDILNQEIDEEY